LVSLQPTQRASRSSTVPAAAQSVWPAYIGIIGLLVLIVVVLAGGIIWYNLRKSTDLMVAVAERQIVETGEKVSDRIRLLYDPLYAIVGIASQMPELEAPFNGNGYAGIPILMRVLSFYPQILSLYVGLDNGDFFVMTNIAGESRTRFRTALEAPDRAAYAIRIMTAASNGTRTERRIFLDENGVEVGHQDAGVTDFDPRQRPWYGLALHSNRVEPSDLYIYHLNNEPGFTLSRSFQAATSGVFGADLTETDLTEFLSKQRITAGSLSFIFTRSGELVAYPDQARMTAILPQSGETMVALPQLSQLKDPVAAELFAAYRERSAAGSFVYRVAGRNYISRVVEIPPRYGRDQLLGIAVPLDEIEHPAIALRNQTLFYSIAFLVFALPLYVTLIVAWIDRRLGRRHAPAYAEDE
jgi:adenylate cyclase